MEKEILLKLKNLNATVKHSEGSVMVWGCMSWSGVGNVEFIDGIMTKTVNLDILRRNPQESVRKLELERRFVFQEDNDPKHTVLIIKDFIKENKIKRLDWPSQSQI